MTPEQYRQLEDHMAKHWPATIRPEHRFRGVKAMPQVQNHNDNPAVIESRNKREQVLRLCAVKITLKRIVKMTGLSESNANYHLRALQKEGIITCDAPKPGMPNLWYRVQ